MVCFSCVDFVSLRINFVGGFSAVGGRLAFNFVFTMNFHLFVCFCFFIHIFACVFVLRIFRFDRGSVQFASALPSFFVFMFSKVRNYLLKLPQNVDCFRGLRVKF